MTAGIVLAVVVAAGEAQAPVTQGIGAAADETLGSAASVTFFEASAGGGDAEALRIEETSAARAVARVWWGDAARTSVSLRVHVARTDKWIERSITFTPVDSPIERGRTIGFAIASMLPEADPTLQPALVSAATETTAPPPTEPLRRRFAGAELLAGSDVDGAARGLGGGVEVGLPASDQMAVRLTAGARGGTIASVPVEGVTATVGVGVAWSPWARLDRTWDLALRADALLVIVGGEHERMMGESGWQATLLPGVDALVELGWTLSGRLQAVVAAGVEIAFGTVDVTVVTTSGAMSARVPTARGVGQAGLRLGF